MKFEWFVASRYLLSRRKQSFISIISVISIAGVGLGVATVILVIAVLDGVDHGLRERFLANEAHVVLRLIDNSFFSGYQNKIEKIKKVEGVVAASPVVYTQMGIFQTGSKGISEAIYIKGIDHTQEDEVTGFSKFVNGSIDFKTSPLIEEVQRREGETITGGIVLGSRLAQRLHLTEGDVLRLVVELVEDPGSFGSLLVDFANFVVIGIYESELAVYDRQIGFIDVETAQKLYKQNGKVNVILIRLEDAELASNIAPKIEDAAFSFIEMPRATTWLETHSALFAALKMEKIATVIIEALIILVAAFNIASTLIMTVMEKTRDVGTLRTLGASRGNVMGIFMIQGSVIGMLGTLAGTALGLYICWLLDTNIIQRSEIFHAVPLIGHWLVSGIDHLLLSTNMIQHSQLYAIIAVGILSLCQVGITLKNIDIVGTVRSIFVLTARVFVLIAGNFVIIAGIFVLKDGMDWLLSFRDWLLSFMTQVLPLALPSWLLITSIVPLLIGVISLLIFWIFVMIKSWSKLPSEWKMIFFPLWLLAISFVLFCLIEPISLKELGFSEIYQMDQLPIKVNWFFVCLMNLLSFEICWLTTIYPAWQASNLKPIEALQYE